MQPREDPAPKRPAWPLGEPADGIPRWLAIVVLVALLLATSASVWMLLSAPVPDAAEPAALEATG